MAKTTASTTAIPALRYTVSMPDPASHTFEVEVAVRGVGDTCVLAFPA